MSKRRTAEEYHAAANVINCEWLGTETPQNNKALTPYRCPRQHEFQSTYNRISRRHGCPICAGNVQKTVNDYEALARERGLVFASRDVATVHTMVWWRCTHNHEFKASYRSIDAGDNCPYCSGRAKLNAGDYSALAEQHGLFFIGTLPPRSNANTLWQCQHGHVFEMRYNSIYNGQGCPDCKRITIGNLKRLKPEAYHCLAETHHLEWLGELPKNNSSKTKWRCKDAGHVFETTYQSVERSETCPLCLDRVNGQLVSGMQRKLHSMIGGILNYPIGRRRIDIAFPDDKIAVEYDCYAWHDPVKDANRDKYLQSHGWRILHVKSGELLPTHAQLDSALKELLSGKTSIEICLDDWRARQYNNPRT